MNKKNMIAEILLVCKANNIKSDGDIFLALCFRSESELIKICNELHIKV